MENTRPPVPPELPALRCACSSFLAILRDVEPGLAQVADVTRLQDPRYAELLDQLRAAQRPFGLGTVAAIRRVVDEITGEV